MTYGLSHIVISLRQKFHSICSNSKYKTSCICYSLIIYNISNKIHLQIECVYFTINKVIDYSSAYIRKQFLLPEDFYFVIKKLSNTL